VASPQIVNPASPEKAVAGTEGGGFRASVKRRRLRGGAQQLGMAVIEFALVVIVAVPLLFGTVALGVNLGRGIEVVQITRDVGHMYSLGVDFTSAGAQNVVNKLAQGFDLSSTGNGVLILSQITTVYQADCDAANLTNQCTNLGEAVFMQRVVLGNTSLRTSAFGTPPANYVAASGNIAPADYYQQGSLIASGFHSVLAQNQGDVAWVVEGYFQPTDISFLSSGFSQASGGTYVRVVF
jgi:hypothetical protein